MCGIFGIVAQKITPPLEKVFKEGLIASTVRGYHGTGIICIDKELVTYTDKSTDTATTFLESLHPLEGIMAVKDPIVYVGHTRQATHGSHITDNCHPFYEKDITLVHNGTLRKTKDLHWGNNEVDSYALTKYLSTALNTKDTAKLLENVEGAYALVWNNLQDDSINFARNSERPLYIADLEDKKGFIFASEKGLLEWIASRNKVQIKDVILLKEGVILSINLETFSPSVVKFKPKATSYSYYKSNTIKSYNSSRKDNFNYGITHEDWDTIDATTYSDNTLPAVSNNSNDLLYIGKQVEIARNKKGKGWILNDTYNTVVSLKHDEYVSSTIQRVKAKIIAIFGNSAVATLISTI